MAVARQDYDSGNDYRLEYGELNFSFNVRDFLERAELAARTLHLVRRELDDQEREDLAELVIDGYPPKHSRSPLGEHLKQHWAIVLLGQHKPVHWLRRLIFRGAWLDQRVLEGELGVKFVDGSMEYTDPRRRDELVELSPAPSFADIAYP